MKRAVTFLYGSTVYLACFGTLTYFMGFVGNLTRLGKRPTASTLSADHAAA